jgi:hypothetical protein
MYGMEWNGMEWNGMEWNVLAAKLLHTGSCAALAEFSLHESFTEHIQVPKSKLEVNQISKLKIRK